MKRDEQESKAVVARYIETLVNQSKYSQKEIADMVGFNTPNIITMIKQGATKVPIEKIPKLAKALDIDRVKFFTFVMQNYKPKEYEAIIEIMGDPISQAERRVVNLVRAMVPEAQLTGDTNLYIDKIRKALSS